MKQETIDLLTLNAARGVGSVLYERLVQYFGSAGNVFKARQSELEKVLRVGPKLGREITRAYEEGLGGEEAQLAQKAGAKIITCNDTDYPKNLKNIFDYPLVLYVKGELKPSDNLALAVVGTRRPSYYGQLQAERLSYFLAQRGITITSGLARGIDSRAHRGAIKARLPNTKNNSGQVGRTIAVLGSGLSRIYPPENRRLADQISQSGAVISELPMKTPPDSRNFPMRNRIISGLSLGVLVIEAPLRSGALITADLALEQGREVFAMPGKIDSLPSRGCHKLLKLGAKLVEDIDDIIEELNYYQDELLPGQKAVKPTKRVEVLDEKEKVILGLLSPDEPKNIDELVTASRLPPALISGALVMMELKKLVKQLPGNNYVSVTN